MLETYQEKASIQKNNIQNTVYYSNNWTDRVLGVLIGI